MSLPSTANRIATLGPFTTTGAFLLRDGRSLAVVGPVAPANATLDITGDLALNSTVTGNAVTLIATGAITEGSGGGVIATTLTGSAVSALLGTGNQVGTLAGFATNAGFTLADRTGLTVSGPVTDGTSVSLSTLGSLTVAGDITAPNTTLAASRGFILQTAGTVTASNQLTLTSAGTISQTGGGLSAGTLTGSSNGATTLASAANRITTLGAFTSSDSFQLTSGGTASLAVDGPVSASSIRIVTSGPLQLRGALTAPTVDLRAIGPITQPSGQIATATLTGNAGAIALTQAANQIEAVGDLSSTGAIALTDGRTLGVLGAVTAGPAASMTLTTDRLQLAPAGRLSAQAVTLQALTPGGGFTLGGDGGLGGSPAVFADTLTIGAATGGPIIVDGGFNLANVRLLRLLSSGAITETPGSAILVPTISGAAGSVDLTGPNQFASVDGFTAAQGSLRLTNAAPLLVGGTVQAHDTAALAVTGGGALTLNGTLIAPTVSLTAASVVQSAGAIQADTLQGDVGTATLGGPNAIGAIGRLSATSLALNDTVALVVAGPVTAGSLALNVAGSIQFTGDVTAGLLQVDAGGTITQTSGSLTADTLTGSAVRLASFGDLAGAGVASIGTLGAMTLTGSTLSLSDARALTVTGPLTAGSITLVAPDRITLQGGSIRSNDATITVLTGQGGTALLQQTGTTTVTPLDGEAGVLRLTVPDGGQIAMNNLVAPAVNVGLVLGNGTTTGALAAANLLVTGAGGSAELTGQVAGLTGFDAAKASRIEPRFDLAYQLNGCAIASTTCGAIERPIEPRMDPPVEPPIIVIDPPIPPPITEPEPITAPIERPEFTGSTVRLGLTTELPSTEPVILVVSELTPKAFLDTLLGNVLKTNIFTTDLITLAIVRDPTDPELVLPNISDRDY